MVCDSEDAVKAVRKWEFNNEVHRDGFKREGCMVGSDGVVRDAGVSHSRFGGLAGGATANKRGDEVLHVGPPVVFGDKETSFHDTRVTHCGGIMVQ